MTPASSPEGRPTAWLLDHEIESVREESKRSGSRVARVLLKSDEVRVVVVGMAQGVAWPEHTAAGRVLIRVEQGSIQLGRKEGTAQFVAGMLIALEPGEPHQVRAVEDSAFLLIVAG